ncbi:MAG: hypothetical protein F6J94_01095 [Moorea sp. SIO1F2]|uniref:hypothetical protein n=1 Tax=unclassified Moorena TaxID=2683338 RepID=UPI0013B67E76|nr:MULTISPECIES: hypothetical protein [unclassified Moorena]NEN96722.1 hypothetical protein [Moorena sp. SIO3I7]NEO05995.1 hypothetical protein [Moorena sp. SIO3I8]NEO21082.1 hypothetical protein [Moorena sp. SIO4A5]NEP25886.1 hypothetical protein [Moorena sp. SIO3I6]NEQ56950.1 hypothetical protein [Moorena sp. SIO4A1]
MMGLYGFTNGSNIIQEFSGDLVTKQQMHRHCVDFTSGLLLEDQATLAPRGIGTTLNQNDSVTSG